MSMMWTWNGTLIHMMWRCPKLVRYWTLVLDTINKVFRVSIQRTPQVYVLGWLDREFFPSQVCTVRSDLLFIAWKRNAQRWIFKTPPTRSPWVSTVSKVIQMEHIVYQHRGNLGKLRKIWDKLLNTMEVYSLQLVRKRLLSMG